MQKKTIQKINVVEDNTCSELENISCAICMELLVEPLKLKPCSHRYCASCIRSYLRTNDKCPLCRATVEGDSLDQNYEKEIKTHLEECKMCEKDYQKKFKYMKLNDLLEGNKVEIVFIIGNEAWKIKSRKCWDGENTLDHGFRCFARLKSADQGYHISDIVDNV